MTRPARKTPGHRFSPRRGEKRARIFAVSTAGRCGTTMTEVTMRSLDVTAATKVAAVSCSSRGAAAPDGNSPESEYG